MPHQLASRDHAQEIMRLSADAERLPGGKDPVNKARTMNAGMQSQQHARIHNKLMAQPFPKIGRQGRRGRSL